VNNRDHKRIIYFIRNEDTGLIKIGHTKNLHQRLTHLRREENTKSIVSLALIKCSDDENARELEKDIHDIFSCFATDKSEWFVPDDLIATYIRLFAICDFPRTPKALVAYLGSSRPEGWMPRRRQNYYDTTQRTDYPLAG
jgi:hypothetical protein